MENHKATAGAIRQAAYRVKVRADGDKKTLRLVVSAKAAEALKELSTTHGVTQGDAFDAALLMVCRGEVQAKKQARSYIGELIKEARDNERRVTPCVDKSTDA